MAKASEVLSIMLPAVPFNRLFAVFAFLLCVTLVEGLSPRQDRTPLQKALAAGWAQRHETPFHVFADRQFRTANTTTRWRRKAALFGGKTASLSAEKDGRYVIVRLAKLHRRNRRLARRLLHRFGDAHAIDAAHMLVFMDTAPRLPEMHNAPLQDLTVMDVYSAPSMARMKLSRAIRLPLSGCAAAAREGGHTEREGEDTFGELWRQWRPGRLPLDVQTAAWREETVVAALSAATQTNDTHSHAPNKHRDSNGSDSPSGRAPSDCRWTLLSAEAGTGLVRWALTLPKGAVMERAELCRCAALVDAVVRLPVVRWMEIAVELPSMQNDCASAIVQQGKQDASSPVRPLWDVGINGSGEIVAVADSGLDFDSCFFNDPEEPVALYPASNTHHRKVLSYKAFDLVPEKYYIGDYSHGHGTHVSGTAVGHVPSKGENYNYNGVAKGAKLFFNSLAPKGERSLMLPSDITKVFHPGYDVGARIFSNSWGFWTPPEYTAVEKRLDTYTSVRWDSVIIFASGNTPSAGLMTPCRTKNMMCIGAHYNSFHRSEQDRIAHFSSYGPTYDKRVKPEIVSAGQQVTSADADENITSHQCSTTTKQGTSMATAVVAGAIALVRQHLREVEQLPTPSAALVKALLIHSSVYLNKWATSGFGRLDLSLFFKPDGVRGWFRDNETISHRAANVYCFTADSTLTEEYDTVKVTLTWTDVGTALEGSSRSLVNDLDIVVVDSAGKLYYADGNKRDNVNVMEQIRLQPSPDLAAGFRVFVYAEDVHDDALQRYALVVSAPNLKEQTDCTTLLSNSSCPGDCSGYGTCLRGVCHCEQGSRFVDCSLCDEETLCHGHGICAPGSRQCTCDNDNFADETCQRCKTGWYGPSCSSDCNCSGHGKCEDLSSGKCTCNQDTTIGGSGCFDGPNCENCCKGFAGDSCNERSFWCGEDGEDVFVEEPNGFIQINGYGSYPTMIICNWVIKAPKGFGIRLQYLFFDLGNEDSLYIFDPVWDEAKPIRTDFGVVTQPTVVNSSSNILALMFVSHWSRVRRGFLLNYTFEKRSSTECGFACVMNSTCDLWNGGFCICAPWRRGWNCDLDVLQRPSKPLELSVSNPASTGTRLQFAINSPTQILLNDLPKPAADCYVSIPIPDVIQRVQHRGLALEASAIGVLENRTVMESTDRVQVSSECRFVRVVISRNLRGIDGSLRLTITLLHNATDTPPVDGGEGIYSGVVFLSSQSKRNGDAFMNSLMTLHCASEAQDGLPDVVFGNTTKNPSSNGTHPSTTNSTKKRESSYSGVFVLSVALSIVGGLAVGVTLAILLYTRRTDDYVISAIAPDIVSQEGDSSLNENEMDQDEMFSSYPSTPRGQRGWRRVQQHGKRRLGDRTYTRVVVEHEDGHDGNGQEMTEVVDRSPSPTPPVPSPPLPPPLPPPAALEQK